MKESADYGIIIELDRLRNAVYALMLIYGACGDNSVATKRNLVEILRFRHFSRHVVFDAEGDKFRNKRIEDYITVSVVIDMECGNTKN